MAYAKSSNTYASLILLMETAQFRVKETGNCIARGGPVRISKKNEQVAGLLKKSRTQLLSVSMHIHAEACVYLQPSLLSE